MGKIKRIIFLCWLPFYCFIFVLAFFIMVIFAIPVCSIRFILKGDDSVKWWLENAWIGSVDWLYDKSKEVLL